MTISAEDPRSIKAIETAAGADATSERVDPESYVLDLKLQVRLPSPNKTIEELAKINPQLPTLLPGLAAMIAPDPVSPLTMTTWKLDLLSGTPECDSIGVLQRGARRSAISLS